MQLLLIFSSARDKCNSCTSILLERKKKLNFHSKKINQKFEWI